MPSGGAGSSAACTPARRLYPATCVPVGPLYANYRLGFVSAFLFGLADLFALLLPLSPTARATTRTTSVLAFSVPRHLCR